MRYSCYSNIECVTGFSSCPPADVLHWNTKTSFLPRLLYCHKVYKRYTMTSVKNVMAIASHLQFLESSLSNILIEAALKLTTLTDSSIFILIDGPNGRKYAGTESLTDTFKKEGLVVENGDAEMNIEGG